MKWLTTLVLETASLVCAGLVFLVITPSALAQFQNPTTVSDETNAPLDLCDAYVCIGKSEAVSPEEYAASLSTSGLLAAASTLPCANGQPRDINGICQQMPACQKQCVGDLPGQFTDSCFSYFDGSTINQLESQTVNGLPCIWFIENQ